MTNEERVLLGAYNALYRYQDFLKYIEFGEFSNDTTNRHIVRLFRDDLYKACEEGINEMRERIETLKITKNGNKEGN